MDFVIFIYLYFTCTAVIVFALIFGDSPALAGTPVSGLKWLVGEAWIDALEWVVSRVFGRRGLKVLDRTTEICCESSNPTLQVAYVLLYATGYGLYWQYVFKLLPNDFAAEYHMYTGTAAVCTTLTAFLIASFSHPGRITKENAAVYLSAYPCDEAMFPSKQCSTCQLMRPGRSKHCSICGSCIPRFDHHCGWINNCVGLHNMRVFLAFLLVNLGVCVYGVLLTAAVVAGELKRRGLFDVYVFDPRLNYRVPLYKRPARLLEWVLVYYPIPLALGMFMAVAGLLMLAFLLYQAYMITQGCTTYETYKMNQLHKQLQVAARQQADADNQADQLQLSSGYKRWSISTLLSSIGVGRRLQHGDMLNVQMPSNVYDKGIWGNWYEVLFPDRFLRQHHTAQGAAPAAAAPNSKKEH